VVHNITWRVLPRRFGHWNSVWKRFWRLSQSGTFEAFFDAFAVMKAPSDGGCSRLCASLIGFLPRSWPGLDAKLQIADF
jgi:hypothetical protein